MIQLIIITTTLPTTTTIITIAQRHLPYNNTLPNDWKNDSNNLHDNTNNDSNNNSNNNKNSSNIPMPRYNNNYNNGQPSRKESEDSPATITYKENESADGIKRSESDDMHQHQSAEKRIVDDAIDFGIKSLQDLVTIKEPTLYQFGLFLDERNPASKVAMFGAPNPKALQLSRLGFAALEASRKIAQTYPANLARQSTQQLLQDECPLRGVPRCTAKSKRYRTEDGTCNSFTKPWQGAALLPMQRFLDPVYADGIQEPRRSAFGNSLPSPRTISLRIHRDNNQEFQTINLLFMQWGQFLDHDLTSTVKSRGFNGTVPRCCAKGGLGFLPPEFLHPNCLPIEVSSDDWLLGPFGIRCLEFTRSAPSTRINCDLGYREQLNQATSYLDGSAIYGSDPDTSNSMRTFRRGKLHYGRPKNSPLQPPDPPNGELCRSGALTTDCFQTGDGRVAEQPGLTALHTIWVRYHNKLATVLGKINLHWSDEKIYQETKRIVTGIVQHITYREFLPIVLGQEVMQLFDLILEQKDYYKGYDERVNPTISNSFSTAAFRFGHSLVQNSFLRFDMKHRPLFNNVSLHQELNNIENIWSFGSLDRLVLGFANQPSQKRDEFICEELTNHLFQSPDGSVPFGLDLAAINIQRGRDHGLPSYTAWREPCGLSPITSWAQLQKIMNPETVHRLKILYRHVNDIDLFTGGLAEKPVRGGIVGPTFACIIAQQFSNLRKGDRFWYENGGFDSSFTPAQLQQIRHITFAHILCQSLAEIETIQPFVFLLADDLQNKRLHCDDPLINQFDLGVWIEKHQSNNIPGARIKRATKKRRTTKRPKVTTIRTKQKLTEPPLKIPVTNVTSNVITIEDKQYYYGYVRPSSIPSRPTYSYDDDISYMVGVVQSTPKPKTTTIKPIEVNIKIQYYPPSSTTPKPPKKKKKRRTTTTTQRPKPTKTSSRPDIFNDDYDNRPSYTYSNRPNGYGTQFEDQPFSTSKRPYIYRPSNNHYIYSEVYTSTTKRPTTKFPSYLYNRPSYQFNDPYSDSFVDRLDYGDIPKRPNFGQSYNTFPGHVEKITSSNLQDELDFKTKFIKMSSVRGAELMNTRFGNVGLQLAQREGDLDLESTIDQKIRIVDLDIIPQEDKWAIFNATDETIEHRLEIPPHDFRTYGTDEIPRPMTLKTQTKT